MDGGWGCFDVGGVCIFLARALEAKYHLSLRHDGCLRSELDFGPNMEKNGREVREF